MNRITTFAACILFIAPIVLSDTPVTTIKSVKVIDVVDGDTIAILIDSKRVRVRLEGIDAPESKQPFASKAKERLSELVNSGEVTLTVTGEDRYGRKLARVFVRTPRCTLDVNVALVREGFAWHYKTYSDDESLAESETLARNERRGLWSDKMPTAPWEWRKLSKVERDRLR